MLVTCDETKKLMTCRFKTNERYRYTHRLTAENKPRICTAAAAAAARCLLDTAALRSGVLSESNATFAENNVLAQLHYCLQAEKKQSASEVLPE